MNRQENITVASKDRLTYENMKIAGGSNVSRRKVYDIPSY